MASTPVIIRSKFRLEPVPADLVERPRLVARLSARLARVSTVVAPAGYGKSVLVSEWRASPHVRARRFVSLRLDERDNDPARFWLHLLAASEELGAILPTAAAALLRDEVRTAPGLAPEATLALLIEALEAAPQRGIAVLDDLDRVTNPAVRDGLGQLLLGLPATTHLVLLSRSSLTDLGVHRLRAANRLDELGRDDLALTPDETARMLQLLGATGLTPVDLEAVVQRTRGWATAVSFAARFLGASGEDRTSAVSFTGTTPDFSDFLVHEILERQSSDINEFLLDVAVLDTLSVAACDAVTDGESAAQLLRSLQEHGLLGTAAADIPEQWLLPPLLREFLLGQLNNTPTRFRRQHARAAAWFQQARDPTQAIEHALLAGDPELAAELMDALVSDLQGEGLDRTLQQWLAAIPTEVLAQHPALALSQAWLLTGTDPTAAVTWCERADAALPTPHRSRAVEDIAVESACVRTVAYLSLGNLRSTLEWGETALSLLDARERTRRHDDSYARLAMTDAVAEAHALNGTPELGIAILREDLERTLDGRNIYAAVSIPGKLAGLSSMVGRLSDVTRYADRALMEAARFGLSGKAPMADAQVALGELHWERDRLDASAAAFLAAIAAATSARRTWIQVRALIGLAKCRSAQHDFDEAETILNTVADVHKTGPLPEFVQAQLAEYQLLLAMRRSNPLEARRWHDELRALPVAAQRVRYLERVIDLAEGRVAEAATQDDLRVEGSKPGRSVHPRWSLEEAVLTMRIDRAQGGSEAEEALLRALALGQASGFVRTLIGPDAGLVLDGLRSLSDRTRTLRGLNADYLDSVNEAASAEVERAERGASARAVVPARGEFVEPFSASELAVVRYLPSDLTYAEIASRRYVSVNTVKSHLKSIYRKLGVTTRAGAAERCRKLGLLS